MGEALIGLLAVGLAAWLLLALAVVLLVLHVRRKVRRRARRESEGRMNALSARICDQLAAGDPGADRLVARYARYDEATRSGRARDHARAAAELWAWSAAEAAADAVTTRVRRASTGTRTRGGPPSRERAAR